MRPSECNGGRIYKCQRTGVPVKRGGVSSRSSRLGVPRKAVGRSASGSAREGTATGIARSGRFYSVVFRILLIFLRTRRTSYEASASAARSSNANTYTYSKGAPRRSAFLHMLLDLCPPATRWHGTHEPGARLRFRSGVRCQDTFSQRRLRACGHTRSRRLRCRQLWARTAPWRGAQPRSGGHARGGFSGVLTGAPRPPAHSVARWCLVIAQGRDRQR